jgi:prepilin-type N-terminal cleavage/methylation domain-containing protein
MILNFSQRNKKQKGFTLVELVMTIVVVGIISIPLAILVREHLRSTVQSNNYAMAMNLARFEMERVKNMSYASVVAANFTNYQGYNFDVTRTVTFVQGTAVTAESLKRVVVTVTQGGVTLATLMTYIPRNVTYGL